VDDRLVNKVVWAVAQLMWAMYFRTGFRGFLLTTPNISSAPPSFVPFYLCPSKIK